MSRTVAVVLSTFRGTVIGLRRSGTVVETSVDNTGATVTFNGKSRRQRQRIACIAGHQRPRVVGPLIASHRHQPGHRLHRHAASIWAQRHDRSRRSRCSTRSAARAAARSTVLLLNTVTGRAASPSTAGRWSRAPAASTSTRALATSRSVSRFNPTGGSLCRGHQPRRRDRGPQRLDQRGRHRNQPRQQRRRPPCASTAASSRSTGANTAFNAINGGTVVVTGPAAQHPITIRRGDRSQRGRHAPLGHRGSDLPEHQHHWRRRTASSSTGRVPPAVSRSPETVARARRQLRPAQAERSAQRPAPTTLRPPRSAQGSCSTTLGTSP